MDISTIKYDASGNQLWIAVYDGGLNDNAVDLTIDNMGNVYVAGNREIANNESQFVTIKYDSNGNKIWLSTYHDENIDIAAALTIDSNGNTYVTGSSEDHYYDKNYTTIKYDNQGTQIWVANYDNSLMDATVAIAIDSAGDVYVTGSSQDQYYNDNYTTIKYDSLGTQLWVASYDNGFNDSAVDLVVDNLGSLYVTGISANGTANDYASVKYDAANGSQLWVSRYDNGDEDQAIGLTVNDAGDIYVTGSSKNSSGKFDYATIKYDKNTGTVIWFSRYDNGEIDTAKDLAIDDTGNIYIFGTSKASAGNQDYATIKYSSQTGDEIWVVRHDSGFIDTAIALSVDTNSFYVTGFRAGNNNIDYATIKYTQSTGPDLVMTGISGPATAVQGDAIVLNSTVENQGGTTAGVFRLGYYLSTDSSITTADVYLGERNEYGLLAAGASSSGNHSFGPLTIPANLTPGSYYIGAIADYLDSVVEDDEANNALSGNSITITISPL